MGKKVSRIACTYFFCLRQRESDMLMLLMDKEDYKKPDLQYGLPAEACGAVPVVRDVRTKEQKTADAKQQEFDRLFGEQPASQTKVQFRVVGIVPDADYAPATNVSQIIRTLLTSSLGMGWFSPLETAMQNPVVPVVFPESDPVATPPPLAYAEFASATQAKTFIDKQSCSPDYGKAAETGTDPAQQCIQAGKPFALSPFGSNSLGLEDARRGFGKIFALAGAGIAILASIIMMGTVGKMISDSRRETAVFRAIGAKKIDIAQIYLLYTVCISLLVVLFALLAGFVGALLMHGHWSAEITRQALVTYNAQDLDRIFTLYTLYVPDLAYLVAIALGAGLLSALFPLFRSLRRNPIKDMRDDT